MGRYPDVDVEVSPTFARTYDWDAIQQESAAGTTYGSLRAFDHHVAALYRDGDTVTAVVERRKAHVEEVVFPLSDAARQLRVVGLDGALLAGRSSDSGSSATWQLAPDGPLRFAVLQSSDDYVPRGPVLTGGTYAVAVVAASSGRLEFLDADGAVEVAVEWADEPARHVVKKVSLPEGEYRLRLDVTGGASGEKWQLLITPAETNLR